MTKAFTKKTALDFLAINTHLFFPPDFAEALCKPFGFKPRCHVEKANPRDPKGLSIDDGRKEMEGVSSFSLAFQLCDHYNCKYVESMGRGSQQRNCIDAVRKHLINLEKVQ